MKKQNYKCLSVVLTMMGCVTFHQSVAQNLEPVPPARVKTLSASLDKTLLPDGANYFEVEQNQIVAAPGITFVPVRFQAVDKGDSSLEPPPTKFYCGLYQLSEGAPAKFLLVFGVGETETAECDGVQAIGAAMPHATHGDLILIFAGYTLHSTGPACVILSWDDVQKQYVVNNDLTRYVGTNIVKRYTISNIRGLLASRAAKH